VALEGLLAETRIDRAARCIELSQPATCHALQHLLQLSSDPLLADF